MELLLSVSEDLDCSGLPLQENTVCVYDEGFLAGILYDFTGKHFDVKEVDCWATGDRTCRFAAKAKHGMVT
jgi:predicted hydrocarbon binding protein